MKTLKKFSNNGAVDILCKFSFPNFMIHISCSPHSSVKSDAEMIYKVKFWDLEECLQKSMILKNKKLDEILWFDHQPFFLLVSHNVAIVSLRSENLTRKIDLFLRFFHYLGNYCKLEKFNSETKITFLFLYKFLSEFAIIGFRWVIMK